MVQPSSIGSQRAELPARQSVRGLPQSVDPANSTQVADTLSEVSNSASTQDAGRLQRVPAEPQMEDSLRTEVNEFFERLRIQNPDSPALSLLQDDDRARPLAYRLESEPGNASAASAPTDPEPSPCEQEEAVFVKAGLIAKTAWQAMSQADQEHLNTPQAMRDWNNYGPDLKEALEKGFKTFSQQDALATICYLDYSRQVECLRTLRLAGCDVANAKVVELLAKSVHNVQTLSAVLEAGAVLSDTLASKALTAVAKLSTGGSQVAYESKLRALIALSQLLASSRTGSNDMTSLEAAGEQAKSHGGLDWDRSNSRYILPSNPYHEYGALQWLVGAGCRVASFAVDILNRTISYENGATIPYLASLGTYRECDSEKQGYSGAAVPMEYAEDMVEAIDLACFLGHDVNASSRPYDIRAIHLAACAHSPNGEVVRFLHRKGAALDTVAKFGDFAGKMLPVGWAVAGALDNGNAGALDALLQCGADPNARDGDGKTALDRLTSFPLSVQEPAMAMTVAELLLKHGACLSNEKAKEDAVERIAKAQERGLEQWGWSDLVSRLEVLSD